MQSEIDPEVFQVDSDSSNLVIRETSNDMKKGVYEILYRVYFTDYPENSVESLEPFVITVLDPCDEPVSLESSLLAD